MLQRRAAVSRALRLFSYTDARVARIAPASPGGDHAAFANDKEREMQETTSKCGTFATAGLAIAWAASFAFACPAHANAVYKCRGADGAVAFQDHACAISESQSEVEIAPAPPASPPPDYGRASRTSHREPRSAHGRAEARVTRPETMSYECRAANGEVFYRHGSCPGKITAKDSATRKSGKQAGEGYAVTAAKLPRSEACRRMASAGSIGRAGHERDESVSSYDRNLGRDPCRYF
jgi:uncharacterized protein DUF4124